MVANPVDSTAAAKAISSEVTAVYVEINPEDTPEIQADWQVWGQDVPLVLVPSPYRSLIGPLMTYLDETDREHNDGQQATVLLPEFVPARWWQNLMHNQSANLLRLAMLYTRRRHGHPRAIIDVPFYIEK